MLQADAAQRLHKILDQQLTLPEAFSSAPTKQAGLIREIVTGSARFYPTLDFFLNQLLQKPLTDSQGLVKSLLIIGLYQAWKLDIPAQVSVNETVSATQHLQQNWAKGLVNAILRNFLRQQAKLEKLAQQDEAAKTAHPLWLLKQYQQEWPNDWQAIIDTNNHPARPCLRINTQKISVADYQAVLTKLNIDSNTVNFAPQALLLPMRSNITKLPGFAKGWFYVQDAGAQACAPHLDLQPGQRILDACAAPGGKTTHLFELEPMLGEVVAMDSDARRLRQLKDNLKRMQLIDAPIKIANAAAQRPDQWWNGKPFDRILIDAPCSATGIIRRHPDIKLHRSEKQLQTNARLQQNLLNALWPCLAPGGKLLYVTCSLAHTEGQGIITNFTQAHEDATLLPLTNSNGSLLPSINNDGFYLACLEKKLGRKV